MSKPITKKMLADCESRAIEIYYAANHDTPAGECRDKLVAEFGEECVKQMLANGIGNNQPNTPPAAPAAPECPLESLVDCVAFDCRDWAEGKRDAWIYGIVCGWDDGSFRELKDKFGWDDAAVGRLKRLHYRFNALREKS